MILFRQLYSHLFEWRTIERPDLNVMALGEKTDPFTGHISQAHVNALSPLLAERSSVNLKCVLGAPTPTSTTAVPLYAAPIITQEKTREPF